MVDLFGAIKSSESTINALNNAFNDPCTEGVILHIDSPGGSPVFAGQIHDAIKRLRATHSNIPIYSVVDEICTSGAYYVAVATDKIYVDKASTVGSIGVIISGFGYDGLMQKLGVERRVISSGEHKALLDPFLPTNPSQVTSLKTQTDEIHQQFIKVVREGRGDRLKETPDMFSGLDWTGETSVTLGLTDAIGTIDDVAKNVIGEGKLVKFKTKTTFSDNIVQYIMENLGGGI